MSLLSSSRRRILAVVVAVLVLVGLGVGAWFLWLRPKSPPLPPPDAPVYQEYAEAFEIGTAALDTAGSQNELAEQKLTRAIDLIPEEPAAWANRGVLYLRGNKELHLAARDLKRAHELAPESPEIEALLGLLADKRGKFDEAAAHLHKAVKGKPHDLAAVYALAKVIGKTGVIGKAGAASAAEQQRLIEAILRVQPNNLTALLERGQLAAGRRDAAALRDTLERLGRLSTGWKEPAARTRLEAVRQAVAKPLPGEVPELLARLDIVLVKELGYQRDLAALKPDPDSLGEPLRQFLKLAPLHNTPASADLGLTFTAGPLGDMAGSKWDVVRPVWLTGEGKPAVFAASARKVRRLDAAGFEQPFPSGDEAIPPTAHGLLALDWDNDQRTDLLLAGAGGLRFWKQGKDGAFTDITAKTGLDAAVLTGKYFGAWAADYDMDGDLDIVLAPRTGPPLVLRNNFDGTFTAVRPFAGVENVRAFAWADLDKGAPDAAFLDAEGKLHVFSNERLGLFRRRDPPDNLGKLIALAAIDLNDDGVFDLAALSADGVVRRISDRDKGKSWDTAEVARWTGAPSAEPGEALLLVADLDNNGGLDLVAAGPRGCRVWLNEGPGKFADLPASPAGRVFAAEDLAGKGRIDLLAVDDKGQPVRLANRGTRPYHWQDVRAVAASGNVSGDNRINSFGIGSEVEARVGTLVQKQLIASPRTHFGLGERKRVDVLRFVWTNGSAQVEFNKPIDEVVRAEQRLKGSCPFLFAHDGKGMQFVTDFLWSSPLGMYVGGQDKGGFQQTQEWAKIRGDQLVPRDGFYDLRVHANLWETHFFDYVALLVVDHPPGTEVFVDERFALEPMTPQIHVTSPPRPVARAWDHHGKDVTELVRTIDGRYLDTCGRGTYQGLTHDHWVEVDLGEDAPREGPVWLLARGWIHPTDSSINVAISQGKHEQPRPLVLEVPDGRGGWKVGRAALGFPAGKNKTMMIRLDGIEGKGVRRRFRLRTNLEIYWDALHYATGLDAGLARQQRLAPDVAELRYRGFLEMTQANASSPELPHYDRVVRGGQRWRDLEGFYTRYGDVRELLAGKATSSGWVGDDRYVIANAGDEIALRFKAPPGPPTGWKRDFVWVADGWEKDGDFNTAASKTVLPLPYHDMKRYARQPAALEDDPVYRRFPDDWRKYHTRYVTPSVFERGLRSFRR